VYLVRGGLLDAAMVERFGLGLADRTLGLRLPVKQVKAGEAIRSRLMELGVFRKDSGHEHLSGSLVVPIRDHDGRIVQMYGRKVTPRLRSGTPLHLYLPGPLNCVFHPEALVVSDEVILCESILDALTFWSAGFHNVTCAFGVHGFTEALHTTMLAHGTQRVLVAYDRDEQGEKAAEELGKKLIAEGIECYRVLFPRGMDANDYANKLQPASKSLDLVLRKAEWMGTGRPPKRQRVGPAAPLPAELSEEAALTLAAPLSAASELDPVELVRPMLEDYLEPATREAVDREATVVASSPAASPASSLLPAPPASGPSLEIREQEVLLALADRRYRVRGLDKNLSYDTLRINLLASRNDGFHVDTLDLYSARQRAAFAKQAASELGIDAKLAQHDLGRVLLALEQLQDEQIKKALAPQQTQVSLSAEDRRAALELLMAPDLVDRIVVDFERCGVVGEETNKLLVYLAAVSRKLDRPLAVMVQSSSAAGKSALMEAALAFVPEEERVAYSAMTGQSLFYMGEKDLKHKVLSIAEEEGAGRASYALKLFQSEGRVSIASTGKDPASGRLVTHEYHVEGPAAILTTTTAIDLDEEFQNRCLVLTVDEGREQTEQIHRFQRRGETLEGLLAREQRSEVLRLHHNAQRLLEPVAVVNRWAEELSYPSTSTRTRRDHMKYLSLIRAIALLHQHQRRSGTVDVGGRTVRYVEATLEDIELANGVAHEVLGRTLDELPPQTQRLLQAIHQLVTGECERLAMEKADYRFSRRDVREAVGWGNTQLKMHLARLEDLEYLIVHRGSRGQSYVYELIYDGEAAERERFMMGLLDVEQLRRRSFDEKKSGSGKGKSAFPFEKSAPSRGRIGPESGPGREPLEPLLASVSAVNGHAAAKSAHQGLPINGASYPLGGRSEGEPGEVGELVAAYAEGA
jgi:DNA primase